jgi:hypothetical protein
MIFASISNRGLRRSHSMLVERGWNSILLFPNDVSNPNQACGGLLISSPDIDSLLEEGYTKSTNEFRSYHQNVDTRNNGSFVIVPRTLILLPIGDGFRYGW